MRHINKASCLLLLTTPCIANSSSVTQNENIISDEVDPYFNVVLGISPFLGILGFEYQSGNHAYGIGLPGRVSYRYYYKPYQDTKFWGMYLGRYSNTSDNKTYSHEGVNYSHVERAYIGAGIGYRWQWPSGWNTSVSIALEYSDDDYSNPASGETATDTGFIPFPGINVGYKF